MATMRSSVRGHLRLGALDLDDEERRRIERVSGMGEGLADLDRLVIHIFHCHGDDPGGDDGRDRLPRFLRRGKAEEHGPRALG